MLNLDQYQPDELKRMGILKADGSLDAARLNAIADHDPSGFARVGVSSADEPAKPGVVFDAGYTMPTENVQNAARRAHIDQAPAMSYLLPASWTGQATTTRNPVRLITRGFEWLINSRNPVARIGRLGARGTLPAISVAHGLSNLSQQAQAQKMLDAIQSNPNVPDATKAEMIKQIIAQFPAVDYENKPQAQP